MPALQFTEQFSDNLTEFTVDPPPARLNLSPDAGTTATATPMAENGD